MGRRQCLHVEQPAVGRSLTMKRRAIPGGYSTILNPHVQLRHSLGNPRTGTQEHPQTETHRPHYLSGVSTSSTHLSCRSAVFVATREIQPIMYYCGLPA